MIQIPRMIMLSGSGKNVGKTTLSTQIIKQVASVGYTVYAIKTSSHLHALDKDENIIEQGDGYDIVEEKRSNNKDSSLMLQAGAIKSFYIQAHNDRLQYACNIVLQKIPNNAPIVCESGGLRAFITPSVFIYLTGNRQNKNEAFRHLADKMLVFNGSGWDNFNSSMIHFNGKKFELSCP